MILSGGGVDYARNTLNGKTETPLTKISGSYCKTRWKQLFNIDSDNI